MVSCHSDNRMLLLLLLLTVYCINMSTRTIIFLTRVLSLYNSNSTKEDPKQTMSWLRDTRVILHVFHNG